MKYVYFIKPVGMQGPIKIGCSVSPTTRRDALATWSPFPLEIVAEIEGSFKLERRFHAHFRAQHQTHEWFEWSLELQSVIDQVAAGQFDVEALPTGKNLSLRKVRWTAAQKLHASYSQRCWRMAHRTGFAAPSRSYAIAEDPALMARLDQYFAEPHRYGFPIAAEWARKLQKAWLAKVAPESAAA